MIDYVQEELAEPFKVAEEKASRENNVLDAQLTLD